MHKVGTDRAIIRQSSGLARALYFVGKLEMAFVRRLPFGVDRLFVLGLNRTINRPVQASSSYHEIFIAELYKPIRPLRAAPTVVDLGANLGMFALYAAKELDAARIYSFEASPNVFPDFLHNVSGLSANLLKTFNLAVTNETGQIDFFIDRTNPASVAATAFREIEKYSNSNDYEKISVPSGKLIDYVPERIDYLKCDIEGAEYTALDAGLFNFDRLGQAVVEFHEPRRNWQRFQDLTTAARDSGFDIFDRDGRVIPPRELAGFQTSDDSRIVRFCHKTLLRKVS